MSFVQYGKTAFDFDNNGEISSEVSYPVIRNLYFNEDRNDAGKLLLIEAMESLGTDERVYAFFHYFGMSYFARHGKFFEKHAHIDALLKENGFEIEHENVYYSSTFKGNESSEVVITANNLTSGEKMNIQNLGNRIMNTYIYKVPCGSFLNSTIGGAFFLLPVFYGPVHNSHTSFKKGDLYGTFIFNLIRS